jgi:hypothetical protein
MTGGKNETKTEKPNNMKRQNMSNSFVTTLADIRAGRVVHELSDHLANLVGKVKETGKAGTLTLKLKIAPASAGDVAQIFVTDAITVALPQPIRPSTLFYPNEDNALLRRDPNQKELPLHSVPGGERPVELKEVAHAS